MTLTETPLRPSGPGALGERIGRYRWTICALLFFATTVNYLDRQVLSILAPTLRDEIGWNDIEYGRIVASFSFAYALGMLLVGRFVDRIGTRRGYAASVGFWSLAAMAHALAATPLGFGVARFALGFAEAGNFPAAMKAVAEWFPKKERAFAFGILNAGTNVGALLAPIVVPWLALTFGWESAFIVAGVIGFLWIVLWLPNYRPAAEHPRVEPAERAHILSDPPEPTVHIPWLRLLPHRQTWAFVLGKFMTDCIWWFYLFWLSLYLDTQFGVKLAGLAAPLIVIYLIADVGSVGGGWLSSYFIKRGWSVARGRKTAMLIFALCVLPVGFVAWAQSMWGAVLLISLAAAAHQAWSANLFTMVSDLFPRRAVASVTGIGGFGGAVGGILFPLAVGQYLEVSDSNYGPIFIVCGLAYVAAIAVIHSLTPRYEPAQVEA